MIGIWKIRRTILRGRQCSCILLPMKVKQTAQDWLDDLWRYEDKHPVAFASPRALVEARLIAEMDRVRKLHPRTHRKGAGRPRKAAVA